MIIVSSQDGMRLIKCDRVYIVYGKNRNGKDEYTIRNIINEDEADDLGVYSSKEQAITVRKAIERHIENFERSKRYKEGYQAKTIYYMPQDNNIKQED